MLLIAKTEACSNFHLFVCYLFFVVVGGGLFLLLFFVNWRTLFQVYSSVLEVDVLQGQHIINI